MALRNIQIVNAKPGDKPYQLNDGNGLFLKIMPNGKRYWLISKSINGKPICKKLGDYPEVGLIEARELFNNFVEGLTARKHSVKTFEDVFLEWLEIKKTQIKNWDDIEKRVNRYLLPKFGKKFFCLIPPIDFIDTLKEDLLKRDKLETIKRICGYLRELEVFALYCGYIMNLRLQNLNTVFPKPQTKLSNRPAVHWKELPEVLKELQVYGLKARETWDVLMCGFYTLLRPNEVCSLEWSWVDYKECVIRVPSETMKMKRGHNVPISKQLLELLNSRPHVGKYVFPNSVKVSEHISTNAASLFLRRHGYKDRLVPHGIRSIGRTWMHDHDIAFDVAELCLAHSVGTSTQLAYDRSDLLDKRKIAMQSWCDYVESCL